MELMGLSFALLAYSNSERINMSRRLEDGTSCNDIVRCIFPRMALVPSGTVRLLDLRIPERGALAAASFEQGVLVSTRDAHLYNPSKLHRRYLKPKYGTVQLFTQRSFNDMFAYARWSHGNLVRSISVNPVGNVWESIGEPESFEIPLWQDSHAIDEYPLPFHPLDMSNAALASELNLCGELAESLPGMCQFDDEVIFTTYTRVTS